MGCHLGINKTFDKISERYHWNGMKDDVKNWCESCSVCAARKSPPPAEAPIHPITEFEKPFDVVGMDFLGPVTQTESGNKYILVFSDYATRWVEIFATKDMKATTVAKILVEEIICRHGSPKALLSDRGTSFLSELIRETCIYFKIKKLNTSPYHPQTNGLTERFNRTICQMLSTYMNDHQTDWDQYLNVCAYAYRTSVQNTVGKSPFELLHGRKANYPMALDRFTRHSSHLEDIQKTWNRAKQSLAEVAEKNKSRHDKKYKEKKFLPGDWVRVSAPATAVGLKKKFKKTMFE